MLPPDNSPCLQWSQRPCGFAAPHGIQKLGWLQHEQSGLSSLLYPTAQSVPLSLCGVICLCELFLNFMGFAQL